jgi:hypothetical protein
VRMAPEARYDASGSFGLSDPEPAIALCWGGALAASSSAWRTLRSWRARSSEWPRGSQKNFRSTLGQAPIVSHPVIALSVMHHLRSLLSPVGWLYAFSGVQTWLLWCSPLPSAPSDNSNNPRTIACYDASGEEVITNTLRKNE